MQTLCPESGIRTAPNWPKNDNDVTISRHDIIFKVFWRGFVSLVTFSDCSKFHVNIITGSGIMTNFFLRDWTEIRKSEIPPSEVCPMYGDWDELRISNLTRMSLIKCCWMPQNSRVTAFTVFELLSENQLEGDKTTHHIY